MTENQQSVVSLVLTQIKPGDVVNENDIGIYVNVFSTINKLSESEKEEVVRHLHEKLSVRMDKGAVVREKNHVSWYYAAKKEIDSLYWERYKLYLQKYANFNSEVVYSLDASTDEMVDLLGDPRLGVGFQRRGLVMGDVQSGKTSTYIALINKAADAGYRVVVLLTGTIEKLRRQTQGRVDEGFIGLDSTAVAKGKENAWIGVGEIDSNFAAVSLTSTSSDFNTSSATKFNGRLASIKSPVVFILKKNKSVLEKLEQWLRTFNANHNDEKVHLPMLLIDDEADNASVNTNGDNNPTTINAAIRKLLALFVQANYVGFTATPYANIFINPESTQEMLEDDLFPRDFIYALDAPTNYVGARGVFGEEAPYGYMVKSNDDCEDIIPLKHKIDFIPGVLPESLKEAICSFFIGNAIRDLRGDTAKHRSMLVNISRFIAVQEQIARAIDGYVRDFQTVIRNHYKMGKFALEMEAFLFLKKVWDTHFAVIPGMEYEWFDIQEVLYEAVAPIVVRTVNGGNAPKNLNYDENEETGLRIIAVGGYSLSRGLTLEGLSVSYFCRNSKMYDTLMQMGRWFGYREGYIDICQIWMSEEAIDWYSYISEATDELRHEIRRMQALNLTPKDFGLCVRSDMMSLLVTARNKMRTAQDYSRTISLSGKVIETPYVSNRTRTLEENRDNTIRFIERLISNGYALQKRDGYALKNYQILDVPKDFIVEYLNTYHSHYLNFDFNTSELLQWINGFRNGIVDYWDIAIAEGDSKKKVTISGIDIVPVTRKFAVKEESDALQMSAQSSRLGSKNLAKGGLTLEQARRIEATANETNDSTSRSFSQEVYFKYADEKERKPLLVIYPVELKTTTKDGTVDPEKQQLVDGLPFPVIGLSIGIPNYGDTEGQTVQYKINLVKSRELFNIGDDEDFEEHDETIDMEV